MDANGNGLLTRSWEKIEFDTGSPIAKDAALDINYLDTPTVPVSGLINRHNMC